MSYLVDLDILRKVPILFLVVVMIRAYSLNTMLNKLRQNKATNNRKVNKHKQQQIQLQHQVQKVHIHQLHKILEISKNLAKSNLIPERISEVVSNIDISKCFKSLPNQTVIPTSQTMLSKTLSLPMCRCQMIFSTTSGDMDIRLFAKCRRTYQHVLDKYVSANQLENVIMENKINKPQEPEF
jgi:hypothetical protein